MYGRRDNIPSTCDRYGTFVTKDNKAISNNRWGADTEQCIETVGDSGFRITRSNHNKNGVASYPSFYEGMWPSANNVTKNSKFPITVSEFLRKQKLIAKYSYTLPNASSHYNVAFDIWFSATKSTKHKLELMIWTHHTGMNPIGKKISTYGNAWDVWSGYLGETHVVSYVRKEKIDKGTVQLNVTEFVKDLVDRKYLVQSDWLTSVQNGFELWRGGAGLSMTEYSLEYAASTTPVPTNPGGNVPTDAENIRSAQVTLNGGETGYPDTFHARLERIASKLRDLAEAPPEVPQNVGGPYWAVEKASDDVAQQLSSRFSALGSNLSTDELVEYLEDMVGTDLVVTPPPAATVPQNMQAVVDSATRQIVLDWDDFPNATGYKIYETASPNGIATVVESNSKRGPFNEYRVYDYWVTAIVNGAETGPSAKASVNYTAPVTPQPDPTTESIYADSPDFASSWSSGQVLDGGKFKSAPWNWQSSTPTVVDAIAPYPDNELRIQFGPNGQQNPANGASAGSGSRRCEVEPNRGISAGRTEFLRWDIRLVNFPRSTGSWNVFYQAKGDGTGSPPMELSVEGGRWKMIYHNNSGGVVRKDDLGPVSTDPNKADIIIAEVAWGSNGSLQVWINDELRLSRRNAPTMHPNKGSYHKMGLYASSAISQAVDVRFEHFAIGSSYDAVR